MKRLVSIIIAVSFLSLSSMASIHFHADNVRHDKCELCIASLGLQAVSIDNSVLSFANLSLLCTITEVISPVPEVAFQNISNRSPPLS
ncbi:MAG: hypothetical protein NT145_07755 [Elusimicrobia bacterium]|nr:hypothetical protein [Elusimicrobiota bacterium]